MAASPMWRLCVAWLLDLIVVLLPGVLAAGIEIVLLGEAWVSPAGSSLDAFASVTHRWWGSIWHGGAGSLAFALAYGFEMGRRSGQTLGRKVTGTVLVRRSGLPLGWQNLAVRLVATPASLALFGAGYFWAIVDVQHRTWHDLAAGTVLVVRRVRI